MNESPDELIVKQPPFPPLSKYGSDSLKGTDFFASWQNFQANDDASNGEIEIIVHLENSDGQTPSAAQINAYRYLKENEPSVTANVLAGLFADYPQIREVYGGIEPEFLPVIEQPEDFRRLIKPLFIRINAESEDDCAYIGFELDCLWDIEHGLGVMTHRNEYIGCNDAEAAWNPDLARS